MLISVGLSLLRHTVVEWAQQNLVKCMRMHTYFYRNEQKALMKEGVHVHQYSQLDSFFFNSLSLRCGDGREQARLVLCIVLFFYLMSCHYAKVSYRLGRGSSQDTAS